MIQVMKDAVHTLQVLQVCRLGGQTMAGDLHDECRLAGMLWSDGVRPGRGLQNLGPQNRDAQNHGARNRGSSAASPHYAESDCWPWESPLGTGHSVQKATVRRDQPTGRRHLATADDKFWGPRWRRTRAFFQASISRRSAESSTRTIRNEAYGEYLPISHAQHPCMLTDGTGRARPKPL